MSWLSLSNLAKQGEAFLDNLDHQAGAVIENVEKKVVHKISDSGREKAPLNNSMDRGSRHNRVSKPFSPARPLSTFFVLCRRQQQLD